MNFHKFRSGGSSSPVYVHSRPAICKVVAADPSKNWKEAVSFLSIPTTWSPSPTREVWTFYKKIFFSALSSAAPKCSRFKEAYSNTSESTLGDLPHCKSWPSFEIFIDVLFPENFVDRKIKYFMRSQNQIRPASSPAYRPFSKMGRYKHLKGTLKGERLPDLNLSAYSRTCPFGHFRVFFRGLFCER